MILKLVVAFLLFKFSQPTNSSELPESFTAPTGSAEDATTENPDENIEIANLNDDQIYGNYISLLPAAFYC